MSSLYVTRISVSCCALWLLRSPLVQRRSSVLLLHFSLPRLLLLLLSRALMEPQSWSGVQVPQTPSLQGEVVFATAENAGKCLASLNQSLGEQGFPAPLLLQGASAAQAAQTCNALYALLLQRQKDLDARSKSNDVQRRLMADLQRAESSSARARDEAEAARDDAAAAVRREKAAALEHSGLLQRLSCERDGAVRDRNALQHKLSQALNDARRREKERDAMAEKLAKLLGDGGRGGAAARGRGIALSGPARAPADAEPAPPDAGAEVNRALVSGLRTRLAAAGAEGSEMRVALIALRDDVRALRTAVGAPAPPDGTDEHAAFDEEAAAASDDEAFAAAACDAGSARHDAAALPFALGGASLVARVRRDLRALRSWALSLSAAARAAAAAAHRAKQDAPATTRATALADEADE